jgi:hypothetical protein
MRHTIGKLTKSTFQRYKVRANLSSDGKFMAPENRGVRVVFSRFSGEDSDQTGEATSESRVASRSWNCSLSYAPRLVDQIVVSRKESAREGSCPEEKRVRFLARFPYFLSVFTRTLDVAPDIGFRRSWCRWKACATLFLKVPDLRETELGLERYGPSNRGHRSVFGLPEGNFPIDIPARPGKILAI